jgi:hypothetical protein
MLQFAPSFQLALFIESWQIKPIGFFHQNASLIFNLQVPFATFQSNLQLSDCIMTDVAVCPKLLAGCVH